MSKLILHIGSHKTGTTSLQAALRAAAGDTAGDDVTIIDRKRVIPSITVSTGAGAGFSTRVRRKVADRIFRPTTAMTVFSDEGLFFLHEPDEVDGLARLLKDRYETIEIYAYVRRQDQMVLSHRKQVAMGLPARSFYESDFLTLPELEPHHSRFLDFHAKLSGLWAAAFGMEALRVIPYDRQRLHGQDVVTDFSHRTGIRLSSAAADQNTALTPAQLVSGLALSRLGLPRHALRSALAEVADQMGPHDARLLPTRAQATGFMAAFANSNARLAAEFSCDGTPVAFSDDYSMYPEETAADWTSEQVFTLLETVLQHLRGTAQAADKETDDLRD
ncbi:hypothetical protein [Tabrizicola oligotrophica]|uniref:Sulfotransferase domain-containing protein n=1 Tax=Tabrizicola oligotrophica TaxID=2710650 RepID=A0A6M0QQX5_9RHOB|nr:hypothetical protein [Tabrizicola oligotrophica]NEY89063.1 hypothetical protein [Tabrizicola oligotrophica]